MCDTPDRPSRVHAPARLRWGVAAALLLCGARSTPAGQEDELPPDIVLVIGDDFSWQDLAAVDTPHVDGLVGDGLAFDGFYSMPLCAPTRAGLFTGRWPRRMGIGDVRSRRSVPAGIISLPKLLKEQGYSTCLVGKWHVGLGQWTEEMGEERLAEFGPQAHGFDHWLAGSPENLNMRGSGYTDWLRVDDDRVTRETEHATRIVRDEAVRWWRATESPRLLVVATQAPHSPFHDPPADLTPQRDRSVDPIETETDMYLAMLQLLDTVLGAVRAEMDGDDWLFFLSDNGTPPGVNGNRKRAKRTTLERGVRVPLVVAGPGVATPGRRTGALVSCVDLYATVARLAGARVPEARLGQGGEDALSFDGAFAAGPAWEGARAWVLSEWFDPLGPARKRDHDLMICDGRWKLRILQMEDRNRKRELLYDLQSDPDELSPVDALGRDPLSKEQKQAYQRLRALSRELPRIPR